MMTLHPLLQTASAPYVRPEKKLETSPTVMSSSLSAAGGLLTTRFAQQTGEELIQ